MEVVVELYCECGSDDFLEVDVLDYTHPNTHREFVCKRCHTRITLIKK